MILIVQHVDIEGPGLIADFFSSSEWELRIINSGNKECLPGSPDDLEGIIILGGPMNVYQQEKYPFLEAEETLIKRACASGVPVLGICLGAQLIAKAGGGRVLPAPQPEIGWKNIRLTPEGKADPLFEDIDPKMRVFQWHQDSFMLPAGGKLLGESKVCPQAFRLGKSVYGLQFHFEIVPQMAEDWLKEYSGSPDTPCGAKSRDILVEAYRSEKFFYRQANRLLLNFSRIIDGN